MPKVLLHLFVGEKLEYNLKCIFASHIKPFQMNQAISGFSKLSKQQKIDAIAERHFQNPEKATQILQQYWNSDEKLQMLHDDFIENTVSNFYLPLSLAPNFLINGDFYTVPMAIEESSVVAAASKAANFWSTRGGFKATVLNTEKIGQVHFIYNGDYRKLQSFFEFLVPKLYEQTETITRNMQTRGGGITAIELRNKTDLITGYYQIHASFETANSMGANFINSCLEVFASTLKAEAKTYADFTDDEREIEVVMSILSNYVPNCIVRAEVSCHVNDLADKNIDNPTQFVTNFLRAIKIAEVEPFRAVTHNKGIMNGIDAVVVATGNDFRAVEAGIHAYASRNGQYSSLSHAKVVDDIFTYWIEIPLSLGTVGGLTSLHPLVKLNLEMLGNPSAQDLMKIVAVAGLAQNFAALRSLTTVGIQQGHMKMHLNNILNQMNATDDERELVKNHFKTNTVSHSAAVNFIENLRK